MIKRLNNINTNMINYLDSIENLNYKIRYIKIRYNKCKQMYSKKSKD